MWTANFLKDPPLSGEVRQANFEGPAARTAEWRWVEFKSAHEESWVGSFRAGRLPTFNSLACPDGRYVFVLAGGVWYCVDAQTRELLGCSSTCDSVALLPIPGGSHVAVADMTSVAILEFGRVLWSTPRLAWDGVRLVSASPTEIVGVAETGHGPHDDREFRIDLRARTVAGGHSEAF